MRDFIYYVGFSMLGLFWLFLTLDFLAGVIFPSYTMKISGLIFNLGSPTQLMTICWLVAAFFCIQARE